MYESNRASYVDSDLAICSNIALSAAVGAGGRPLEVATEGQEKKPMIDMHTYAWNMICAEGPLSEEWGGEECKYVMSDIEEESDVHILVWADILVLNAGSPQYIHVRKDALVSELLSDTQQPVVPST